MITAQNHINVIGNNIANSKTTGYKKDIGTSKVFEESFMRSLTEGESKRIGKYQHQVHTDEVHTSFQQGNLILTDKMLDFAVEDLDDSFINFINVEYNGERYLTRDGAFQVDEVGNLSMNDGSFVLDSNGNRINLSNIKSVVLTNDGYLMDADNGSRIAQLGISTVAVENQALLEKKFDNKYKEIAIEDFISNYGELENILNNYDNNISLRRLFPNRNTLVNLVETGEVNITQNGNSFAMLHGALESSNVNLSKELTDLMLAQHTFQANSKVVQVFDQINDKDANRIGI